MTETLPAPATAAPTRDTALADYALGWRSRHASLLGRKEVLTGKAKFGIFGDGKEVAQLAMARAFRPGDVRAGYYRDQTFMMAVGRLTLEQFFAQLYADADREREPASAGRQMNAHFATRMRGPDGAWLDLTAGPHSAADMSPTAGQMPKLVGLGHASRLYRELPGLAEAATFSNGGSEIAFGTIGNASCAEGHFWEAVNAIGVLRAAVLLSIWDDGYGISVPNEFQIAKRDLSDLLAGFRRSTVEGAAEGFDLYAVEGWNYPALCETYAAAAEKVRTEHVPAILHVRDVTQPQGHSTSGSHERYKSKARLAWEEEFDPLAKMRRWMIEAELATAEELAEIEKQAARDVRAAQRRAWEEFQAPIAAERGELVALAHDLAAAGADDVRAAVESSAGAVSRQQPVLRRHLQAAAHEMLVATVGRESPARAALARWTSAHLEANERLYASDLYAEGPDSPLALAPVAARYGDDSPVVNGFEILNACFDAAFDRMPNLVAFGEDVGQLGDVNQGMLGLQAKHGKLRVSDTGIREQTIMGQAIGLALRGIRPIAEIQYLDYVLYGLQTISDDLSTLRWRTAGQQAAPVIVRTRGHRLEGIWHSGSPMGGLLHLVRGIWVCVPRNMTQAAGMYNTLLAGDDPGIVVEVLNGYRQKEKLPANVGEFRVPLGVPEVLRPGTDLTLVTYGACCRIAAEAADQLASLGVETEIVDVQTLTPFDREDVILASLKKTNRLMIVDEDVPGGASAYILQQVLERCGGFWWLDAAPVTVTGTDHRPAYGSDGDYFSKPSKEEILRAAYALVREGNPRKYPELGI
jgi:2-oxoisovalerate dehydrogenase E1 component